jgi:nucleoside-diphosphate-sugar epimerase
MRVLVTGASGLIGSHVVAQLARRGGEVRALVRREAAASLVESLGAEPVAGDVRNRRSFLAAATGVDVLVHAAALVTSWRTLEAFEDVNVGGVIHAVEAAEAAGGARVIHLSSTSVYGRGLRGGPVEEGFPFTRLPRNDFYARTKRAAEDALFRTARARGVHATALRPCVVYGERDRHLSARVARLLARGVAPLVGRGRNTLACVYAGNVAEAVSRAIEIDHPSGRVYNVTNDGDITARSFLAGFAEGMGVRRLRLVPIPPWAARGALLSITAAARLAAPRRYAGVAPAAVRFLTRDNPYSSARARDELGWEPVVDPAEAVHRTGASFRRS